MFYVRQAYLKNKEEIKYLGFKNKHSVIAPLFLLIAFLWTLSQLKFASSVSSLNLIKQVKVHSLAFATVLTAGQVQEKQGVIFGNGGDGHGFILNGTFISVQGPVARSPLRVSVGVLSTKGSYS